MNRKKQTRRRFLRQVAGAITGTVVAPTIAPATSPAGTRLKMSVRIVAATPNFSSLRAADRERAGRDPRAVGAGSPPGEPLMAARPIGRGRCVGSSAKGSVRASAGRSSRPEAPEAQAKGQYIGLMALFCLMGLAFFNDILRLFG